MNASIKYFGFGTNRDIEMMAHMVGRQNIVGEPGKLIGYELGILRADRFRDEIPEASPLDISPRTMIVDVWGPDFEMYVSRPNPDGNVYGTIWELTSAELDLVSEWEMVEYGAQENAKAMAIDSRGNIIEVVTQSFLKSPIPEINRIIKGNDYEPYIARKEEMLKKADECRLEYLRKKQYNY